MLKLRREFLGLSEIPAGISWNLRYFLKKFLLIITFLVISFKTYYNWPAIYTNARHKPTTYLKQMLDLRP